ncbi:uncharacterized protein Z520_00481 [Fonsecaea multimorphosa CBS 102226]|uniref:Major facilitator superfamily (MFS) profile domain-containing protein n=1 Tax=Fonsecaea multimorphosa CBS 102226 TaxID=1442371 RepID=A0A0D2KJZ2_9EURO|nr:uncharacterized protein Z520_00481 [Fonsecaea multimorphosa CBS 102226]KIY03790.1 hypothetical protein Z520_00481 [Fonsecaea multimorphosa CBS 102226]
MAFGILEIKAEHHVAGTVLLDQRAAHSEAVTNPLKHGRGKDDNIILAPQPSEDPNDPLNWSNPKKYAVFAIIAFGTLFIVSVAGGMLSPGLIRISMDLKQSPTAISKLSGYMQLASGATGPFISAWARKCGKRPVYLLSSVLGLIGCIIGECATGYNQLVAARVIQGIASAAYESLVLSSVGDLFFVHERAPLMALVILVWTAATVAVSIIAGPITTNLGWKYNFHILMPLLAVQTIAAIFFMPETVYRRDAIYEIDVLGSDEDLQKLGYVEHRHQRRQRKDNDIKVQEDGKDERDVAEAENAELGRTTTSATTASTIPPPKTWLQQMAVYNGIFVQDSILKMVIACPAILLNLSALWAVFAYGSSVCWQITTAVMASIFFAGPPYLYTTAQIGYTSVGSMIGALLACLIMGIIADPITKAMSRRNRGVFEPEFHLPMVFVGSAFAIAGMIGEGHAITQAQSVYLICFCWGLNSFGLGVIAISVNTYILAAFRNYSTEIFIMAMVFRSFVGYGIADVIVDWYMSAGPVQIFDITAGIVGAFCLLSVPLYVFGKRYRSYWQHHNLIKILNLETDKTGTEDA